MDEPRVVAITGLGTLVGRGLVQRILHHHPGVTLVGIDRRRPPWLDSRVRYHRVDLATPTAATRLAEVLGGESVEAVLHAAFRNDPSADLELDHELETIGSLHVMNACAATGVGRLVFASSTMLYGPWPDNPNFLSEGHPLRGHPEAHSVNNRVEAEGLLAAWRERHPGVEVTVLRSCWTLGPRSFGRVAAYLSLPVVPKLLGFDPLMQFIHEEDCLNAFERAVLAPHPGVFNLVGPGVLPLSTLLRLAGKRVLSLPAALLYRMAYIPAQSVSGDHPDGFYSYLRHQWVADGARGWETFGEPLYTTKEAWIAFVSAARMRRHR